MKILIFVDMEGISGIPGADFTGIAKPHYQRGQKFMTWDVNACISGCLLPKDQVHALIKGKG